MMGLEGKENGWDEKGRENRVSRVRENDGREERKS